MKAKSDILFLKIVIISIIAFIQVEIAVTAQYFVPKISKITDEKGVSPGSTFAIVKDSLGFIWFGTVEGLYRYDGYNFKIFRNQRDNNNSLSNNTIRSLCLGRGGKLWIATQGGGVDCFDIKTEEFTHYSSNGKSENELSGNSVWTVIEDKSGNIWMGVAGEGIDKLDIQTKKFTHFDIIKEETPDTYEIRNLFQDDKGLIWVANGSYGLFVLNPGIGTVKNYVHNPNDPSSLSSNGVFDIYQDKSGRLWIGTYGGGLNLFDYKTETFTHISNNQQNTNSLISNLIYSITEKPGGGFWISTEFGLCFMDENLNNFVHYVSNRFDNNSLTDNRIRTTYVDNQGILWIGTEIGVDKLVEQSRFMVYKNLPNNSNSLESGIVRSILEDNENNLWIGLIDKGLVHYNRKLKTFKTYKHEAKNPKSISGNHITALFQDSNNEIWIGEWDTGLLKFNKKTGGFDRIVNSFTGKSRLSDNRIQVIREDKPGVLWIGTEGGVNNYNVNTGEISYFKHDSKNPNSLNANGVQSNAFIVDSDGNLWVGMWSSGLNKIEFTDATHKKAKYKSWQNDLNNNNSLNNNNVISLHLDKSGILWIGTYGGGLNKFDIKAGKFSHYTTDDGLPDNIIYAILEDEKQNLWMSTDKGISKFNPETLVFQNFDHTDGLQDDHFFWGSSFKSKNGELFFGGINGFNSFYPDNVRVSNMPAEPMVLSIKVFDKPIAINYSMDGNNQLELDYNQNFLTFEFSGLDYIEPQKNTFRYILEGVDKNWNSNGSRRYATYTDISPGTYSFRLSVSNSFGIWSTKELVLKIIINPPWWKTLWAKALFLILIVGGILLFYYLRVGMLEIQKQKLEEQVALRTNEILYKNDSLRQKNDEILVQKEALSLQTINLNEKNIQLEKALNELEIAQQALIESEKMASLGVLSAGIAHEINNPLNFITLSIVNIKSEIEGIEKLEKKVGQEVQNNLLKLLDYAQIGTSRISKIVESLKFYSQTGSVKMQSCNIEELINSSILIIHSKIPSFIKLELYFKQIPTINCKPDQISQVLINIMDNAIQAISEKKETNDEKIIISTELAQRNEKEYISIQIANTGPELSEELIAHIFDPFYTTKAPNEGTGLGLYISYNIIKDHRGLLMAENKDQMVTFTILIPD